MLRKDKKILPNIKIFFIKIMYLCSNKINFKIHVIFQNQK